MVAVEDHIVQRRYVRTHDHESSLRARYGYDRPPSPKADAPDGADVTLRSDLDRTVFDHDVGSGKRWEQLQIGFQLQANDGSALWIDRDLTGIACGFRECAHAI